MNLDLSRESLLGAARRAAELYADIYLGLEDRRVAPGATREEIEAMFRDSVSDEGVGLERTVEEFAEKVLPNSMGTPHPLYCGLVNSSPLPAGPLADLLISSLNNNGGAYHQSPAITVTEQIVIQEFSRLCRMGNEGAGMILPGGTFANLQGLMLARQAYFPSWNQEGPKAITCQPRLYRSEATHFCVDRTAMVLGIGRNGVVQVPSVGRGHMDLGALESRIEQDRREGHLPFAVVANAGTTGTGAMDDIEGIANICERHQIWLHVDACYGGGALLLDPVPNELNGIGRADSVAIDPHKWFFIPMTAAMLLTPHRQLELETFNVDAPYIPGDAVDAFQRGVPTSRRSSGLAIWMALRAHGWGEIRETIQRNIHLTRQLESRLQDAGFRVLEDGKLSVACARWEPAGVEDRQLNDLQTFIARSVVATGQAWFSTVTHRESVWLRINLLSIHTREHHIETLTRLITQAAVQSGS